MVFIAGASFLLWRLAPQAVLCVWPSGMRLDIDTPAHATEVPGVMEELDGQLKSLGFSVAGIHREKSPLAPERYVLDWTHETLPVCAFAPLGGDDVTLLSRSPSLCVVTSNFARPSFERHDYLSGGLDGVSMERLLKAHLRRLPVSGEAQSFVSLETCVSAIADWYQGAGRSELRRRHALALLWSVGALGMVGVLTLRLLSGER